ncbi:MAG: zinc-ribbon domain-containing protein [Alicyclobacillus sp.]|nr:zinc-ribbon domain-containing protein [Alicyclobacillus sp.]
MQRWVDMERRLARLRGLLTEAGRELQALERGFLEVSAALEQAKAESESALGMEQIDAIVQGGTRTSHARRRRRRFTSLADAYPAVAALWDEARNGGMTAHEIAKSSARRVWWRCPDCNHTWEASVLSQTTRKYGCPNCGRAARKTSAQDGGGRKLTETLAGTFPKLAAEWHPVRNGDLRPDSVSPRAHTKAWWICSNCGCEFSTRVVNRTIGTRCPNCGQLTTT